MPWTNILAYLQTFIVQATEHHFAAPTYSFLASLTKKKFGNVETRSDGGHAAADDDADADDEKGQEIF